MKPVRILQLTDLHVFADGETLLKGIPTRKLLESVIDSIHHSGMDFDHVVITGDHTHDELPESYQYVRRLMTPWLDRLWQVPGNHDDRTVLQSVFSDRIQIGPGGLINFLFSAGDWLCAGLDTHLPGEVAGNIDEAQVEWLRRQIDDRSPAQVVLFMHHPPVKINSVWMDKIGLRGSELLLRYLSQEPRIRLVCCGHVHHESTRTAGSAVVVTTPSTGIQFSPDGEVPTFERAAPGFRIVELSENSFAARVIRLPDALYSPVN